MADGVAPRLISGALVDPTNEQAAREILSSEGCAPFAWGDAADARHTDHAHPYHKILLCLEGSARVVFAEANDECDFRAGDRLEIPAGICHRVEIGPTGITCLEGHRSRSLAP
ncbi:MAG: cupin domain-containing protein [Chloroflexi bacterium]|nr:cupin domain-containing protein [Chloroflexota bacterium]